MKTCTLCQETKPREDFYLQKRRNGTYSHMSRCKRCPCKKASEHAASLVGAAKDKADRQMKNRNLRMKFNLSLEDYERILEAQGEVCAICRQPETSRHVKGTIRRLAVDHDHETGEVRGLLCWMCNSRLGYFEHHDLMGSLLRYLELEETA